jgi:hypothetical protein
MRQWVPAVLCVAALLGAVLTWHALAAPSRSLVTAAAAAAPPAPTTEAVAPHPADSVFPTAIEVPPKLARHTRLELSGIAWLPELGRYVVVSDDISATRKKHAPLLFTLSDGGRLDEKPTRIDGIHELNDPESVTLGPDGSVFVCTSRSANRHGQLRESRSMLLQLAIGSDRRARILGQADLRLAPATDAAPGSSAGQSPWLALELDIEAIAYREGALYIGLKAPLGPEGRARILRLSDPIQALAAGHIAPGSLSLWSESRFCVPRNGESVCEGIADLAFLGDGQLLVLGNSPKHLPSDGGGSLWQLSAPNAEPRLLQRFPGLKPEGISLTPDRQQAVIVFDRDGAPPLWARWRLGT